MVAIDVRDNKGDETVNTSLSLHQLLSLVLNRISELTKFLILHLSFQRYMPEMDVHMK